MPARTPIPLSALTGQVFDLLVIGGGITGAGIARDAALRGLSVALVEKDDFASGTSSRSSRLIHGGVRYLEHGHLHLVFEASAERRRLLRLAPHLVRPLSFTWPVYRGARIGRWKLAAGLLLYDLLALFRNVGRHERLSARGVTTREPALARAGLRGGARYWDAATDDTRLTLANALGAADAGARVRNHTAVTGLRREGDAWAVHLRDLLDGADAVARARVVVNATGPWSDTVRELAQGRSGTMVRGSAGAHIVVPRDRIGNHDALTLLSPRDGRVMFALPAGAHSLLGTTETPTHAPPDDVRASEAEIQYLLDSANAFFPDARLTRADVVSAWSGIRPLAAASGDSLGETSREHAIEMRDALLTITGGKLTTYRVMAADAVDAAEKALERKHRGPNRTATLPLPGGMIASVDAEIDEATRVTGAADVARRLVEAHGDRWRGVWAVGGGIAGGRERIVAGLPYLRAELAWALEQEMAMTLGDLLVRRTHVAFETPDNGRAAAVEVAKWIAPLAGWDERRAAVELDRYDAEVKRIFT